ncbi:MAG TPA: hypothetical protein EYQ21_03605, partial [Flavobacteriales bacterium]|nr:hypothetical protein [Flavobacteriales bacterium]
MLERQTGKILSQSDQIERSDVGMRTMRPLQERFDEKYTVVHEEPTKYHDGIHWMWTACLGSGGYGKIWEKGKPKEAHRASYELHTGKIPEGLC